jgi:MarR family transcriptional regulator, organic hydroperoxide resistance regulator
VRALEREGFVARSIHPADPRAVELSLTEHGAVTLDQATKLVYRLRDQLTSPLGGNEGAATKELAAVLRQLLDEPQPS